MLRRMDLNQNDDTTLTVDANSSQNKIHNSSSVRMWKLAYVFVGFIIGKMHGSGKVIEDCPTTTNGVNGTKIRGSHSTQQSSLEMSLAQEDPPPTIDKNNKLQAMDWKIPDDVQKERHKECEGKKTSSTGGFCLTMTNVIGGNNLVDVPLAEHMRDVLFNGMDVVDLGAGLGKTSFSSPSC